MRCSLPPPPLNMTFTLALFLLHPVPIDTNVVVAEAGEVFVASEAVVRFASAATTVTKS